MKSFKHTAGVILVSFHVVLFQVISERLFSSMSSSRRSSLSSSSVHTECEDVEDKNETKVVSTSKECENHAEQEPKTGKI